MIRIRHRAAHYRNPYVIEKRRRLFGLVWWKALWWTSTLEEAEYYAESFNQVVRSWDDNGVEVKL